MAEAPPPPTQPFVSAKWAGISAAYWWLCSVWAFAHPVSEWTLREPNLVTYEYFSSSNTGTKPEDWLTVRRKGAKSAIYRCGKRLVLHTHGDSIPPSVTHRLTEAGAAWEATATTTVTVVHCPSSRAALNLAAQLADEEAVLACYPVRKAPLSKRGPYAPFPTDTYFLSQTYLENRDQSTGISQGPDLNLRAAWPFNRGAGVRMAIVDDGVDFAHSDLQASGLGQAHRNFITGSTNGAPRVSFHGHGTAVAGLAAARSDNAIGIAGTAPEAGLASWVIFDTDDTIVDSLALSDVFEFENEAIPIQNHSWGNGLVELLGPSLIEQIALSNAFYHARGGKGVVMVRAGGNGRASEPLDLGERDANEDGYASHPGAIAVAAIQDSGRAATYSSRGACLLVAGPGGENESPLFTTDRPGSLGFTRFAVTEDLMDYGFGASGFVGTSGSAPLISGIIALMLAENPELSVRDIQQILLLAARHFDTTDPDLHVNQFGRTVSHNVGFGVPDAAQAVRIAKNWPSRPASVQRTFTSDVQKSIPDDGLFVATTGTDLPAELVRIPASPSQGLHPDTPTDSLPVIDIGQALSPVADALTGNGALIKRGGIDFIDKIQHAADAGAAFAVVYNNVGTTDRLRMLETYYAPIPAVFIGQTAGETLVAQAGADPSLRVHLAMDSATYRFFVPETLSCEHVGVRIRTSHIRRGDLRITLTSPAGTLSILQQLNSDGSPGPTDWTYYSTHHFFESATGTWTIAVTDMVAGNAGDVLEVELIIHGVPITDTDTDGLDDSWEITHFQSLAETPQADADDDGIPNGVEWLRGLDPNLSDYSLNLDLSVWKPGILRLSWPVRPNHAYQVESRNNATETGNIIETLLPAPFETEWLTPATGPSSRYFRVFDLPIPVE